MRWEPTLWRLGSAALARSAAAVSAIPLIAPGEAVPFGSTSFVECGSLSEGLFTLCDDGVACTSHALARAALAPAAVVRSVGGAAPVLAYRVLHIAF